MAAVQLPSLPLQAAQPSRTQKLLAKLLQGRIPEGYTVADKHRPLELLDLPLDILQAIVKEVTHTNDLTSLALSHSTLHSLAVPHIYSRFDIVWPEANPTVESRVGVDALTYGLATLVMAHDVFGEAPHQQLCPNCEHCQEHKPRLQSRNLPIRIRRGNYFAQHTRKFSLGNGPADWVTEYLITKEGGKMLGTLVALALGRMRNLEAFIWDMPTGVLRDVWLALASLGNRYDGKECRLEKVWVRWHDNRDAVPLSPPQPQGTAVPHTNLPSLLQGTASSLFQIPPYPTVEFPTFSILPPLKSISVLDIDEIPYAEELSVLLERSIDILQELRVGVAIHAQRDLPFRPIEDRSTVPPPFPTSHEFSRPGGILGILVSRFIPLFGATPITSGSTTLTNAIDTTPAVLMEANEDLRAYLPTKEMDTFEEVETTDVNQLGLLLSAHSLHDESVEMNTHAFATQAVSSPKELDQTRYGFSQSTKEYQRKLKLSNLELERIYLSIPVLSRAVDWSRLESLTLLGCMNHEQLWKALRRTFAPVSPRTRSSSAKLSSAVKQRSGSLSTSDAAEYKLGIKRIHTDTVSKALLFFIRETLAPDTLEWLFLQETSTYKSSVEMDEIYKAVRRHKGSLRKLLIDSEIRSSNRHERDRERDPVDMSWRRWKSRQDLITLITSEKMQLRELSLCIDHKHWHCFLQHLPFANTLRSLHISHIADHPYGRSFDPHEVALQVLDIVSLRSEIELCYLGVEKKCFEILECKSNCVRRGMPIHAPNGLTNAVGVNAHSYAHIDDDDDDDDDHDDGGHNQYMNINQYDLPTTSDDSDGWDINSNATSHLDEDDDNDDMQDGEQDAESRKSTFTLREILFYDDKISIFKARHGKL